MEPDYDRRYSTDGDAYDNGNTNNDNSPHHSHHLRQEDFTSLEIPPDYADDETGEHERRQTPSYDRRHSDTRTGAVNTGFQGDDDVDGRNARETIEMRGMGERNLGESANERSLGYLGSSEGHQGIYLRRAKSLHQNGFQYYHQHRRHGSDVKVEPSPDYPMDVEPDHNFTMDDIRTTWQVMKTLKVRRKTKKLGSSKRRADGEEGEDGGGDVYVGAGLGESRRSRGVGDDGGELGDEDVEDSNDGDSYEEEIGLPSFQGRTKGLAEKMMLARQLDSAAEVARQYERRDSIWEVKQRTYTGRRKVSPFTKAGRTIGDWISVLSYKLSFWSHHFKEIEGQFGIATTTYFRFTRWLIKINLLVFLIFLSFLYVPQFITFAEPSKNLFIRETPVNVSEATNQGLYQSVTCSSVYGDHVDNISDYTGIPVVLDFAKGTGLLEDTFIFYGRYSNLSVTYQSPSGSNKVSTDFNMSLVYMLVMLGSFLIIFIKIVTTSSKSVKDTIMDLDDKAIPSYSNAVFSGWDYCIHSDKMAGYKQNIIYNDFQAKLEEIRIKKRQQMRTSQERLRLYAKRVLINFLVLCILGGCFTAIIFTTNFLLEKQEENLGEVESLLIEFLPSIVITILNFVIPLIFMVLVEKEEYSPTLSTSLTIIRAVFLRISLVGVLLFSIYNRLFHRRDRESYSCPEEELQYETTTCCGNPLWKTNTVEEKGSVKCWETYVGQQFYKLAIADFFNVCLFYFGFCAFRKFLYTKLKDRVWCVGTLGLARFDLPLEVLDIVYTQTLCWVGMFFAPLLPTFCLFQTFIYFFVKKFLLLRLCEPPKLTYRASRNYSFFQVVLLVTFTTICIVLGYMIGNIQPSKSCGPFRVWATSQYVMFDAVTNEVQTWPSVPRGIFNFFGTVAFIVPAFLVVGMAIYYYWAVTQGYKRLETLLEQQVKSESHDKQYLLLRVDEAIKRGQLDLHTS